MDATCTDRPMGLFHHGGQIPAQYGTCHVGTGKLSITDFRDIIESQDRSRAGSSAPAHALYLERVVYPSDLFL